MKTKLALLALALGASTCILSAQDGPPPSGNQPPPPRQGGPGGPGAPGGFHLLPPGAQQQLQLTDGQKAQIAALENETRAKLEKILTPEQMAQLKTMRPPMRQGGPGGPPMRGGPNGPGRNGGGNPGGDDNNLPPGPPPGGDDGNMGPPGPPPGGN